MLKNKIISKPRVFIPIFPGTNGEYESIKTFQSEGAIVNDFVFKNINNKNITESIKYFNKYIKSSQIIMFCGGFSFGDEPDGSAKFIVSILHNSYIKHSIHNFLKKHGLILGVCNGFQALIKSGLLPNGNISIRNIDSITILKNKTKKHISQCVNIKIITDNSPWLIGMKNEIYTLPISHGEGRIYGSKYTIKNLEKNNQIAAKYVDLNGNISIKRSYNPNGSIESIEGLLSNNGRIYGRMTHPERCYEQNLLKNIPNIRKDPIFSNAIKYFS